MGNIFLWYVRRSKIDKLGKAFFISVVEHCVFDSNILVDMI